MDLVSGENTSSELLQAQAHVYNYTFNFINSMAVKCVIELGIPEVIRNHGQPMKLTRISTSLNIPSNKVDSLQRVMRILVHSGFFARERNQEDEVYALTPVSKLLLKDEPFQAAGFAQLILDPVMSDPFHVMSKWFQNNDKTLFETAHGKGFWDYIVEKPHLQKELYNALTGDSQMIASVVMKDCKHVFEGLNSLVDVAGSRGDMAKAILSAFPHMKCFVLDLPHVVDNLPGSDNLVYVGGDMFRSVPPADAVLLKVKLNIILLHSHGYID